MRAEYSKIWATSLTSKRWLFTARGFVKSFECVILRVIRICSGAPPILAFIILKMTEDSSIISHHQHQQFTREMFLSLNHDGMPSFVSGNVYQPEIDQIQFLPKSSQSPSQDDVFLSRFACPPVLHLIFSVISVIFSMNLPTFGGRRFAKQLAAFDTRMRGLRCQREKSSETLGGGWWGTVTMASS